MGKVIMKKGKFICRMIIMVAFVLTTSNAISTNRPNQRYKYQKPKQFNDGWQVASLESVGVDVAKIESVTHRMITEEDHEFVLSMAIVKDGKLVHEAYSPYCQRNTLHVLASITKTVTSTLIGIAIDKGFIESVNTPVRNYLSHYSDAIKDPNFNKVTFKHIMTMSSGLDWNERVSYNNPSNSEYQMVETDDWMGYILKHRVKDTPGSKFNYNTGCMHLLSAAIRGATDLYVHQFAEKYLFHPMGIYGYHWNRDPKGYPCTGGTDGGVALRARDVAKFGWLFLRDGTWQGKRIIPEAWIEEATRGHMPKPYGRGEYGYNWHPGTMTVNGKTFKYKATFGYGGQTLYIVPEYDLIIVFTCELAEGNAGVHRLVRDTFEAVIR